MDDLKKVGLTPFVEGTVGFAFADSRGENNPSTGANIGLGQDFNFAFGASTGIRYDFAQNWFTRVACQYYHYSNAGLSEPARANNAIDALGPIVSVGYQF